jgi:hypothetical protein
MAEYLLVHRWEWWSDTGFIHGGQKGGMQSKEENMGIDELSQRSKTWGSYPYQQ